MLTFENGLPAIYKVNCLSPLFFLHVLCKIEIGEYTSAHPVFYHFDDKKKNKQIVRFEIRTFF